MCYYDTVYLHLLEVLQIVHLKNEGGEDNSDGEEQEVTFSNIEVNRSYSNGKCHMFCETMISTRRMPSLRSTKVSS